MKTSKVVQMMQENTCKGFDGFFVTDKWRYFMKILLLGGTGAIGTALVDKLAKRDDEVYVTTRSSHTSQFCNVHYLTGNAHDADFLSEVLKNRFDVIVDFMIYTLEEFQARIEFFLNSTDHYLFLSSSTVYANSEEPIIEESLRLLDVCTDANLLNSDFYPIKKAKEEDLLRASGRKNWTIIRPYISYNTERLQLGVFEKEVWLWRALNGRSIPLPRDVAERRTTMTYSIDVAEMMLRIIGNKHSYGETYHLTGSQSITWKEVLDIYCTVIEEKTGKKAKIYMPDRCDEIAEIIGNRDSFQYDRLYDRVFDNAKILQLYSNSYQFTSIQDGLSRCLRSFIESPRYKSINIKLEAYFNRKTGEKTPLVEFKTWKLKTMYLGYYYFPGILQRISVLCKKARKAGQKR